MSNYCFLKSIKMRLFLQKPISALFLRGFTFRFVHFCLHMFRGISILKINKWLRLKFYSRILREKHISGIHFPIKKNNYYPLFKREIKRESVKISSFVFNISIITIFSLISPVPNPFSFCSIMSMPFFTCNPSISIIFPFGKT